MSFSISLPGQSKNVLLAGDEGISVYHVSGSGVRYIDHLAWLTPDFEEKLKEIFKKDCPKKPITILYDMVEQHYRKEMVPKVGALDKANVIKRKVAITFPNYKIRAAIELRERKGLKGGGKGLENVPYLFAAIPSSELLSSLLRAVILSGMPIDGLYLLPVEGVGMISKLAKKLGRGDKRPIRWAIFMGQHASGNLRQVVVKDGELALTRMTPFSEDQEDMSAWAQGIHQEFKVTMSYLTRLGYNPEDGVNVVLIGPDGVETYLSNYFTDDKSVNLALLTIQEAANILGLSIGMIDEAEYADLLYISWAGQGGRMSLPMPVDNFEKVKKPRFIANVAMVMVALAAGWFGYQALISAKEYAAVRFDLESRKAQLRGAQDEYALLLDEKEKEGYDIRLYKGSFNAIEELDAYSLRPFKIIKGIADALGPVLSIDEVRIRHRDTDQIDFEDALKAPDSMIRVRPSKKASKEVQSKYESYTRISMTFSSSVAQEEANKILRSLINQIKQRLPDYKVNLEKAVKDRSYQVDVEGQIGGQSNQLDIQEDNTAVIEIRGGT